MAQTKAHRQPYPVPGGGTSTPFAIPPFVLDGSLYISTSPRWYPEQTVGVDRLFASLVTAGSTSTVVRVRKNGSVIGTLTLTASDLAEGVGFTATTFTGPETDYMTVEVQTVGAGAAGLTVQVS